MKTIKCFILGIISLIALTFSAQATTFLFDFGSGGMLTGGNYNDFPDNNASVTNIIDDTSTPSTITVMTSGWNIGVNTTGTSTPFGDAAIFDPLATSDNYFGHTNNFNQPSPKPLGLVTFTGLDASGATAYTFTFFGSRMDAVDNREAQFAVFGANSGTNTLNTSNNESEVAGVTNIVPTGAGTITVQVSRGPNNDNSSGYFYLGAMRMVTGVAPTIPNITNQPAHVTVSAGANATFTVGVSNPSGVTYQWQRGGTNLVNGGNISGATATTLTVSGVTSGDVGHYRVHATNPQGTANSLDATLAIVGIGFYPAVTINGLVGDTYRVDYATALAPATWIPLSTNVLVTSPQVVTDSTSPGNNTRFYRAVYLP
jgi:hypothetical protein